MILSNQRDDFKLGVDQGIPCGLILNEVISNSFEHAFTDQYKGSIIIHITNKGNRIILTVKDDGKGLPAIFDESERESLGITLVESLCKQLEGRYLFENTERNKIYA